MPEKAPEVGYSALKVVKMASDEKLNFFLLSPEPQLSFKKKIRSLAQLVKK